MKNLLLVVIFILISSNLLSAATSSNVTQCRCQDEGVTLTVISGCENWNDATECTGWASVAHENGKSETDLFPDKTQLTAMNCTIQINCPSNNSTNDAGSTVTEEKKDEEGWCSILSLW